MEIRVLKYFLTVAREGSITRAAEILHVTQPTLSRQILELERETGVKLLDRGSRHVSLTSDAGSFSKGVLRKSSISSTRRKKNSPAARPSRAR